MKLNPHWRKSWKFISNWAHAGQAAAIVAWVAIPSDLRAVVPAWVMIALAVTLFLLGFAGTNIKQTLNGNDNVSQPSSGSTV